MKPITAGLAMALAAFAVSAPSKSTITKVEKTNVGGGVEIVVSGESLNAPKTFFANSAKTLYVVQFNATMTPNPGKFQVGTAGLDYVRYARYQANPPISRLVLQVDKGVVPTVTSESGTWYVRVGVSADHKTAKTTNNDDLAMKTAIDELANTGSSVAAQNAHVKNLLTPGAIVSAEKTASFTEAAYSSTISAPKVPEPTGSPFKDTSITLVVEQANVLSILRSFAAQTDVNIIVSPDVSPSDKPLLLTMSMRNVDLDFAMTSVSSLAGLRFTRIGNTYVVCNAVDFNSKIGNIFANSGVRFESRVVEIGSGEAKQIRDATLQAIPQDGPDGYYEILDPTSVERYGANAALANGNTAGSTGTAGNAGTGTGTGTSGTGGSAPAALRARYVTVVGEPRRIEAIERFIRDLDKNISASFSLAGATNFGSVVVPIMSGQTAKIKDMLGNLLTQNPRKNDYTIEETSVKELAEGDESVKMLLIAGPKDELEVLRSFADQLDASMCELKGIERNTDPESFKQSYEVVDLKYIEPTIAAYDLKARVKGLHVTILPDPVTPGITGEEKDEKNVTNAEGSGAGTTTPKTANLNRQIGHEQMRLVMRGTRAQLDEAKSYLASVDLPARQVAIELRVMELTRQDALKLGLDWSILTGGRLTSFRMNQGLGNVIADPGSFTGHYQDNATTSFDVLGRLDAIANRNNLIARPNALITDGRSTHLFVGDTIRYIKALVSSANGTTVEVGEVEVGVKVDVDARIGADGNIALDLRQNFSLLTSFTPVPGGGVIPQTSDRSTEMMVNLMSGETLALGGLILEQDRKSVAGIPILKDLPLIGELFKRTDNRKERTEVVFFLTAKVVENGTKATAADPRAQDGVNPTVPPTTKGKGK